MKKLFNVVLLILAASLFSACVDPVPFISHEENGNGSGNSTPDFNADAEVTACFNLVNEFRTGSEAWFWNEDNSSKTDLTGKLGTLVLDEELCKAAQIRADEIVQSFSHTRPNGETCFTVIKECGISWSKIGENIAAGNKTGSATFNQWKEDGEQYSGQGHRRNMLGDFTKIGIAYTHAPDSYYGYYWTMILTK